MSDSAPQPEGDAPRQLHAIDLRPKSTRAIEPLSRFIGRDSDLRAICTELGNADVRLLTLTGPGGVGKTRLALQAASEVKSLFPDGVEFIFLARTRNPNRVLLEIAETIGLTDRPDIDTRKRLLTWLQSKTMLLVLDNFEHVVSAATEIGDLLSRCPGVSVLATSRINLNIYGERIYDVPPMEIDAESGCESQESAVLLFQDRARAVDAKFSLTNDNRPLIRDICRRLDGLPLAIELAAARLNVLSLQELHHHLKPRLPLLSSTSGNVPDRLRTMRNAVAWSYDLLSPDAKLLFRWLSVFSNGFTLVAAAALMDEPGNDVHVIDRISTLTHSSLVIKASDSAETPRFRMLETIREFGQEQLERHTERQEVLHRLSKWIISFVEEQSQYLVGESQRDGLQRIDAERDNIETALTHSLETKDAISGLRICTALWLYWNTRGMASDGAKWTTMFLDLNGSVPKRLQAAALFTQGILSSQSGNDDLASSAADESERLSRELADPLQMGLTMYLQGLTANKMRDWDRATQALEESRENFRMADQFSAESAVLNDLGRTAYLRGQFDLANDRFNQALDISRNYRVPRSIAMSLHNLGNLATERGDYQQAAAQNLECLEINLEYGDDWHIVLPLVSLVRVAAETGHMMLAARLTGVAEALVDQPDVTLWDWSIPTDYADTLQATREILANDHLQASIAQGRKLSIVEAISEARILGHDDSDFDQEVPLTPRERDVLRLMVSNLNDREIGEKLFISHRTVQTHMSSIYRKLGVHTRPEAINDALRRGLS